MDCAEWLLDGNKKARSGHNSRDDLLLHGGQSLFHQTAPHLLLVLRRDLGVADHMDDTIAQHQPVGADHFCHWQRRGNLHCGDTGFFQLRSDRSAAASAGPSSRGENNRVDA